MLKRLLPLALSLLLIPAALPAQQAQDAKPAEEKKPDAFQYFFGKKREEKKAEAKKEEPKAEPEAAPEPQPVAEPEPEPVQPEPAKAEPVQAEPVQPAPAPKPQPVAKAEPVRSEPTKVEPANVEPKADAFQYFFGRPAPRAQAKPAEGEKKPVDAFEYFFGKNGKADSIEEEKEDGPPPGW